MGVYNKADGKFHTAINSMHGYLPDDIFLSYIRTHGTGSHAEIYAVNKALLDYENANIGYLNQLQKFHLLHVHTVGIS